MLNDLMALFQQQQQEQPDMARDILSQRFQPTFQDVGNSALASVSGGEYVNPQQYADARMGNTMKQMAMVAELQKLQKGSEFDQLVNTYQSLPESDPRKAFYGDRLKKETTASSLFGSPIAGVDPRTGLPAFGSKSDAVAGGLLPPAPAGQKYMPDGTLRKIEPSVRDQMRIQKSTEGASAATNVERLGNEAVDILGRYNTGKTAKIRGEAAAWYDDLIGNSVPEQELKDYQRLNSISSDLGAQALQQFGGNDTDRELMIAITTGIDPKALTDVNINIAKRKILAAKILQQKPIFEEEWLNKTGSLTAPDPQTGATFSRVWLASQKKMWDDGLKEMGGGTNTRTAQPVDITRPNAQPQPPTPEEIAEYKRIKGIK